MRRSTKILWGILISLLGILLLIYIFIAFYYKERFYFGSLINNIDYSGKTVEEVEENIASEIALYSITITGRDGLKETIAAQDMNYRYVSDGQIHALKEEQNPFMWPFSYFNEEYKEMTATCEYDRDLLLEVIDNLSFFQKENTVSPKDAFIDYDGEKYYIEKEVLGTTLKKKKVIELIEASIDSNEEEISLEEAGCYKEPSIYSNEKKLTKAVKKLNTYTGLTITYDFGDRTEILGPDTLIDWVSYDEDFKVTIDEQKAVDYVNFLGYYYTTFGSTRDFTNNKGKVIQVKGGDYGWVINRSKEAEELIKVIKKGKSVTREPVYSQTAVSRNKNDIGDTYIEVDLKKQRLWLFVDGKKILESPIVTGDARRNYETPPGIYCITYKERDATLNGENYSSPVSYWMPFNHNIGFHDAPWRSKFGKKIYKTNGSHGCVNMPPNKAQKLYENIQKGTPVVVY